MDTICGILTIIQEDRFQLADENGHKRLFLLSNRARTGIEDLRAYERERRRVTVEYEPADALIAAVARRVSPVKGGRA